MDGTSLLWSLLFANGLQLPHTPAWCFAAVCTALLLALCAFVWGLWKSATPCLT